jgi:2-C-methyl-D-erythritol 2,4-cyclodiphosphate synthase
VHVQRPTRCSTHTIAAVPASSPHLPYRVGHGFDLHRMAEGYDLIIGGIKIPHTKGCEAHSDGDVLLHCVTDSILGARPTARILLLHCDVNAGMQLTIEAHGTL